MQISLMNQYLHCFLQASLTSVSSPLAHCSHCHQHAQIGSCHSSTQKLPNCRDSQTQGASESSGGLVKTDYYGPALEFLIQQVWQGLKLCISNKLPSDMDAVGSQGSQLEKHYPVAQILNSSSGIQGSCPRAPMTQLQHYLLPACSLPHHAWNSLFPGTGGPS